MDALEALERFKSTGETKQVKQFKDTPSLKFDKKGGQFVIGTFLQRRDLKEGSKAGKSVIELALIDTNATFTVKNGENYDAVSVNPGDKVAIFAPTALDNFMRNVASNVEVYISCAGKVKEVKNGKAIEFYKFDVRIK
jgi:hypothetical protein